MRRPLFPTSRDTDAKFTPGPWGMEVTADGCWIGPMRAAGDKVAGIVVKVDTDREYRMEVRAERVANARLIAAAPDAVTLAEAVLDESEQPHLRAMARDWLAKARGEA